MFQVANLTLASTWNNLLTKKRISLPKTYVLPTFRQIPQRKDILIWPWNNSYDLVAKEEDGYITDKKLVSLVTRTACTLKRKHRRSWSFITSKIRNKSDENRIYNIPKLSQEGKRTVSTSETSSIVSTGNSCLYRASMMCSLCLRLLFLSCHTPDTIRISIGAAKVSRLFQIDFFVSDTS